MTSGSIVRQLLGSTLLILVVLWTGMVVSVALVIKHETDEIFDASLQETAQRLLPLAIMQLDPEDHAMEHPQAADEGALEPAQHKEYLVYQMFHASGRMLLRSHAAPTTPLAPELKPGFQDTEDHLVYIERSRNGDYLLAIAERSGHRSETLLNTLTFLLMPLLALLPLSALSLLVIVKKASQPLRMLDAELSRRGSSDLKPVSTQDLPQELQPLAHTLNQLMHRLKSALEAERHFTANSAHELRTPLAAAAVQMSLLEKTALTEEQRKTLSTVRQLLQRLQTLSEKLLQLARAESGIAFKRGVVDLGPLLQLLCNDHRWRTGAKIDLGLAVSPVTVEGDVDALGIVLGNLLENAIKYATPGSAVRVELRTSPTRIWIANDCEPLPVATLERLHERFYRARPDSHGAGLGLSIVRTLLTPMGIGLQLRSPATGSDRGFEAELTWTSYLSDSTLSE